MSVNGLNNFSSSSIRLWQLISPTLPIGSFCYSQGLEHAVEAGWINNEATSRDWILGQLKNNLASLEVPVFLRMYQAWQNNDFQQIQYWNDMVLALREADELKQEDCTLAGAMKKLLQGLDVTFPEQIKNDTAFITTFSFACQHWSIDKFEAVHGLLWSWCDNQVTAALKLVPLGQTSGQKIMSESITVITQAIEKGVLCEDDDIGSFAPAVAIGSALHETQYSRLFRS